MNADGKDKSPRSLQNLGALPDNPPTTSTGKVAWAWPQISAALQAGRRMSEVWSAFRADGFDIPYKHFRVYVSRLRRRYAQTPPPIVVTKRPDETIVPAEPDVRADPAPTQAGDPYAGIREQRKLKRRAGFEYDPFSTDKDLLK